MKDKCPYCDSIGAISDYVYFYIEKNGSKRCNIKCKYCESIFTAYLKRTVTTVEIKKTTSKNIDFNL
jgi:MoaA/NifB/PqqE/SkfB family radical SAM enzyme